MAVGWGRRWAPQPVFRMSQNVRPDRSPQIPTDPCRPCQGTCSPPPSPIVLVLGWHNSVSPCLASGPRSNLQSKNVPGRDGVKIVVRSGPVFFAVSPWGRQGDRLGLALFVEARVASLAHALNLSGSLGSTEVGRVGHGL